jgi:aminopeptidase-like protein
MPEFNNLTELYKYLQNEMREVMNNEMADMVKKKESESVEKNVYDVYKPNNGKPFVYDRRKTNGGLADESNMKHTVKNTSNSVELSVKNTTKGKDQNFQIADLVEYGDGYNNKEYEYKTNRDGTASEYLSGRPFTEKTEEDILQSNEHVTVMKNGLKSRGIDVT